MRFVVDRHLGRIAKWLRTMGFDAFYDVNCPDERLREECRREGSVLVTTAESIGSNLQAPRTVLVPKEETGDQIRTLVQELHLDPRAGLFTRCVICNLPVHPVRPEVCADLIPPHVRASTSRFTRCTQCGRVYWEGSHTKRLRDALENILREQER